MKAQQRHPEMQKIYLIFFKIELENKRQVEKELALQHANIVYINGKKKFVDIDYFIEMLKIVDQFPYAKSIQQTILDDMKQTFEHNELLWHTLAQRALNGFTAIDESTEISEAIKEEEEDGDETKKKVAPKQELPTINCTLKQRIKLCIYTYESAVLVVSILIVTLNDIFINITSIFIYKKIEKEN